MDRMTCDECGADVGQDGVLTVILQKTDKGIEHLDWRNCRSCALKAVKKEDM